MDGTMCFHFRLSIAVDNPVFWGKLFKKSYTTKETEVLYTNNTGRTEIINLEATCKKILIQSENDKKLKTIDEELDY